MALRLSGCSVDPSIVWVDIGGVGGPQDQETADLWGHEDMYQSLKVLVKCTQGQTELSTHLPDK